MGKCQVFMLGLCKQTDGQMDNSKTIFPDLSLQGHKKQDFRSDQFNRQEDQDGPILLT